MFKTYDQKISKILSEKNSHSDWNKILKYHQTILTRIQHERLIHLLVTIFVGIVMAMASFIIIVAKNTNLLFFCIPLILLFIGYILHYRFLENTTQKWYLLEDRIREYCDNN